MRVSVPGNLLLSGEYAVTLEDGKGIGCAVDTRATIISKPADRMSLTCLFQNQTHRWSQGSPIPKSLRLIEWIMREAPPLPSPLKVIIDSSDFYYPDGRKRGFGSSAAIAAGLTFLFLYHAFGKPPDIRRCVFPAALSIHRKYQGGKGSGYDIAASLFGGVGLFTGGERPSWTPVSPPCTALFLARGEKEASTMNALERFQSYAARHPAETREFLRQSNAAVDQFLCGDIQLALSQSRLLHRWIHNRLNLPSEGQTLRRLLQAFPGKALGAGGEIAALLVTPEQRPPQGLEPLRYATKGIRWQE